MTVAQDRRAPATHAQLNSGKPEKLGQLRVVPGARGYAPPASDTAPLPDPVVKALRAIVSDMRNIPRDVITDRGELVHFLNRMARRVEGVSTLRIAFAPPAPKRSPAAVMATTGNGQNDHAPAIAGFSGIEGVPASQEGLVRCDPTSNHSLSGHALADAVFGPNVGNSHTSTARRDETRTVLSRKGRAVRVQTRRASEAGQMELLV